MHYSFQLALKMGPTDPSVRGPADAGTMPTGPWCWTPWWVEPRASLQEQLSLVQGWRSSKSEQAEQAGSQGWWPLGLACAGFTPALSGPLIPSRAARVHLGKAASPFLHPLGPDILLSGLGEAQDLIPSTSGQSVALDEMLGEVFLRWAGIPSAIATLSVFSEFW